MQRWSWQHPSEAVSESEILHALFRSGTMVNIGQVDHFYLLHIVIDACGTEKDGYNITRVAYSPAGGLKLVWTSCIGCAGVEVGSWIWMYVFPASDSLPEEVLLLTDGVWVFVDGASGALLQFDYTPPLGEVAVLGNGSTHQILVTLPASDPTDPTSVTPYQLTANGALKALAASATYDAHAEDIAVSFDGQSWANRVSTLPLWKTLVIPWRLYGLDTLTGKTVWDASNTSLFTGDWVRAYPNFKVLVRELRCTSYAARLRADIFRCLQLDRRHQQHQYHCQVRTDGQMSGRLLAESVVTPALHDGFGYSLIWSQMDGTSSIDLELLTKDNRYWVALDVFNLSMISFGQLPTETSVFEDITFVGATEGDVAVVLNDGSTALTIKGQHVKGFPLQGQPPQEYTTRRAVCHGRRKLRQ